MVTANELLNSLSATNSETEGHIVIGIDRHVTVPASLKRIAVQYDHNVETVTFDSPRYWDDLDMSTMAIYINYMRSDGYRDSYPVDDVEVDGDMMHFKWTISRNATEVKGNLTFLVCIKKSDDSGNEVNHWNSELCTDMYVSEGMETQEQVLESFPDLVTQLLLRMNSVEEINIQADEMNALYGNVIREGGSILAETEAARDIAVDESNYIKNSYANAIKGNADGEIISVDDVSPIEHDVKCKVRGKNLIPFPYITGSTTENGVTIDVGSDGGVTFSGTPTAYVGLHLANITDIPNNKVLYMGIYGEFTNVLVQATFYDKIGVNVGATTTTSSKMIDMTAYPNAEKIIVEVKRAVDGVETNGTVYPILSTTETDYEPYIDPTTVTVMGCGKNLVTYPYKDKTTTNLGITFTDRGNGLIHITGTATNYAVYFIDSTGLNFKSGVTYSIVQPKTRNVNLVVNYIDADGKEKWASDDLAWSKDYVYKGLYIQVNPDVVVDEIYIPIVKSADEPLNTYTPASDGTCTVTSKSPTMTLFADTPGVTIEAEYNRDTTKAMTSYIFTDEIKDEIAAKVEDDMAEVLASLNSYAASLIGGDS